MSFVSGVLSKPQKWFGRSRLTDVTLSIVLGIASGVASYLILTGYADCSNRKPFGRYCHSISSSLAACCWFGRAGSARRCRQRAGIGRCALHGRMIAFFRQLLPCPPYWSRFPLSTLDRGLDIGSRTKTIIENTTACQRLFGRATRQPTRDLSVMVSDLHQRAMYTDRPPSFPLSGGAGSFA